MIVHQSQAGCIIGRQGFKIKELREVSFVVQPETRTVVKASNGSICRYIDMLMNRKAYVGDIRTVKIDLIVFSRRCLRDKIVENK